MNIKRFDELIEIRISELERELKFLKKTNVDTLKGTVNGYRKGKKKHYILRMRDGAGQYTAKHVMNESKDILFSYAERDYAQKMIPLLQRELKSLQRLSVQAIHRRREYLQSALKKKYGEYAFASPVDYALAALQWAEMSFETNSYPISETEKRITDRGDTVRSKLECLAANCLFAMNLPYRYECRLYLRKSDEVRYPDFTVMSPLDGKIIYIEVFGMMDDPDYVQQTIKKINQYAAEGIVIGKNFIPVFECSGAPFDPRVFRMQVEACLNQI